MRAKLSQDLQSQSFWREIAHTAVVAIFSTSQLLLPPNQPLCFLPGDTFTTQPRQVRRAATAFEHAQPKAPVVCAFGEGGNWRAVASANDVEYHTARRAIIANSECPKKYGGLRRTTIKMTVDVMCKNEEYIEKDCRQTLEQICDRLFSEMGAVLSTSSMHRALQGMLYSIKKLRIEKTTMNSIDNKTKRKDFVVALNSHIDNGNMIIFHDETNLNEYLTRSQGRSRVGDRATVALPPSKEKNLHVQGGVSSRKHVITRQFVCTR